MPHPLIAPLRKVFRTVNFTVLGTTATLIVAFMLYGTLFREQAAATFELTRNFITEYFGWHYVLTVTFLLVFALWLMFSRYGDIRLGHARERPEFGFISWFSMVFSAGMGIGLIFWSVAEPISFFIDPPRGAARTAEAVETAMLFTFFHWGLHAWAIYCVVGLTLAYFAYRFGMPFTLRSIFYPLLGDRIYGPIGHAIDIIAVFATLFGLATSLGLGVLQLNTGLQRLTGMEVSVGNQVMLIAAITSIAVASVVSGLARGLKWLSLLNMLVGLLLMAFVFLAGSTLFSVRLMLDSLGNYLQEIVALSFRNNAVEEARFQQQWTLFYWAWWISWSPFVGIFIARVSQGRTIRQFVAGTLLVPTLIVFAWLAVSGGTALELEFRAGAEGAGIAAAVERDVTLALFVMLEQLPWSLVSSTVATLLVVTFFVTSSDSATHVVDALLTRGSKRSPTRQRVIWGFTEGAVAAVLLVAGGTAALQALQTASIAAGLPFSLILLFMCYSFWIALRREFSVPAVASGQAART